MLLSALDAVVLVAALRGEQTAERVTVLEHELPAATWIAFARDTPRGPALVVVVDPRVERERHAGIVAAAELLAREGLTASGRRGRNEGAGADGMGEAIAG